MNQEKILCLKEFGFDSKYYLFPNGKVYNQETKQFLKATENRYTLGKRKISVKSLYLKVYGKIFCNDNIEDLPNEQWKEYPNNKNYLVSNCGRIKSLWGYEAKILKPTPSNKGYLYVKINGINRYIHRIVAETFIRRIEENEEVHHKNTNRNDNTLNNLEILTIEEHHKKHRKEREQ